MSSFTLHDLEKRVHERATGERGRLLYPQALDRGVAHCAKKLGEEAVETVIAALEEDRERLTAEAADLIYHLLVVLRRADITLAEVEAVARERTKQSGLDEKASRKARLNAARTFDGAAHRRRRPVALPRLFRGRNGRSGAATRR